MMKLTFSPIMYLDLRQPITEESIFCFDLDTEQAASIEVEKDRLLAATCKVAANIQTGRYIFSQYRRDTHLNQDEWLDMAIEQQKDALCERNKLANQIYVRFLYEDGKHVTQVFRSILKA